MKILIKKSRFRQKYHFVVLAHNGEIVATSENYYNQKDCEDTCKLLIKEMGNALVIYDYKVK